MGVAVVTCWWECQAFCWPPLGFAPLLRQYHTTPPTHQGNNTALHWAAMRGHVEVVRALVVAGANRGAVNKQGRVPLDLCEPQWSLSWRFTREVLATAA